VRVRAAGEKINVSKQHQNILLESGTNEVEIAEIKLGKQSFGVNVAKIREFITFDGVDVSKLPGRHQSVLGVFILRGGSIPLVDLKQHLDMSDSESSQRQVVVITEFNRMRTAFVADYIDRIHRISWQEFNPLNTTLAGYAQQVIGSVQIEEREILILDMEHIIGEIFPETVINYDESQVEAPQRASAREEVKVLFVEDSNIIRHKVSKILRTIGYTNLETASNGEEGLAKVRAMAAEAAKRNEDISHHLQLVLTDIEMPKMDGLALCRTIKKEMQLNLPVIMFSSLINDQMIEKCRSVGAEGYASKPETARVIELLDEYCLKG